MGELISKLEKCFRKSFMINLLAVKTAIGHFVNMRHAMTCAVKHVGGVFVQWTQLVEVHRCKKTTRQTLTDGMVRKVDNSCCYTIGTFGLSFMITFYTFSGTYR